jgi:hypothetical protein
LPAPTIVTLVMAAIVAKVAAEIVAVATMERLDLSPG